MRITYSLIFCLFLCSCGSENEPTETTSEEIDTPVQDSTLTEVEEVLPEIEEDLSAFEIENFEILESVTGDLDKDGIPETVVAYQAGTEDIYGNDRVIYIYKGSSEEGWKEWSASSTAIMPSGSGGMMGDGFDGLEIKKGILEVRHWGGSREKWAYTHKYRFQSNDFYLIGVTSSSGAPCEYWEDFDYNLSTGDINFKLEHDNCPDEDITSDMTEFNSDFTVKLDELPKFSTIKLIETEVIDPYTGEVCHY